MTAGTSVSEKACDSRRKWTSMTLMSASAKHDGDRPTMGCGTGWPAPCPRRRGVRRVEGRARVRNAEKIQTRTAGLDERPRVRASGGFRQTEGPLAGIARAHRIMVAGAGYRRRPPFVLPTGGTQPACLGWAHLSRDTRRRRRPGALRVGDAERAHPLPSVAGWRRHQREPALGQLLRPGIDLAGGVEPEADLQPVPIWLARRAGS